MALLFVSYRDSTAAAYASRLHDWLAARFGKDAIFYDRGALQPGETWNARLERELEKRGRGARGHRSKLARVLRAENGSR